MKNYLKKIIAALVVLCLLPGIVSCGEETKTEAPQTNGTTEASAGTLEATGVWKEAKYLKDTELGSGKKTVKVKVVAEEKSVLFTLHTDKETVGEALMEHQLVEGDAGQYGLYIKKVNGILADYDADKTYWGFYQNGEYMMTGVDTTKISGGESYELVRTK